MQATVQRFASSLSDVGATLTTTTPGDFASTVDDVVEQPAVGVPLAYDGLSLSDTVVETPPTPRLLREAETGITPVGKAIVASGTLLLDGDAVGTEPVSLYPPTHVAVVRESDLISAVADATDYLGDRLRDGESSVFATGASSTGDMGALVEGVHGPKHVSVVLVEGR